ncbi:MAG: DUF4249 domain-containing protein [Bacteroidota bacterium]
MEKAKTYKLRLIVGEYYHTLRHVLGLPYLGICLLLTGCIEEVDLTTNSYEEELVIYGSVSKGVGEQVVKVGMTRPFRSVVDQPESGANVYITDQNSEQYTLQETEEGTYIWDNADRPVKVGDSFTLFVELADGRQFQSTTELVPENVPVKDVYFELTEEEVVNEIGNPVIDRFVDVFLDIDVPDTDAPVFLRWETENVYLFIEAAITDTRCGIPNIPRTCFVYDGFTQPKEVVTFDGSNKKKGLIEGLWVGRKPFDSTFNQRNIFSIYQHAFSSNSYEYWRDVSEVQEQSGRVFDTPPAAVRGNIVNLDDPNEIVLGHFQAINVDTIRYDIWKQDLAPAVVPPYCFPRWFDPCTYYPPCLNCILIPNSTYTRPSFLR